jgi:hypothetical protein
MPIEVVVANLPYFANGAVAATTIPQCLGPHVLERQIPFVALTSLYLGMEAGNSWRERSGEDEILYSTHDENTASAGFT